MSTTTISLAIDAYHRLTDEKRPDESFTDVVRRLTTDADLAAHHGALAGTDLADALEAADRTDAS